MSAISLHEQILKNNSNILIFMILSKWNLLFQSHDFPASIYFPTWNTDRAVKQLHWQALFLIGRFTRNIWFFSGYNLNHSDPYLIKAVSLHEKPLVQNPRLVKFIWD